MRSVAFTTLTRSPETVLQRAAAAMTSNMTSVPTPTRTGTFVGRAKSPDASTSPAVDLSLHWTKPNSCGLLRADHETDIVIRVDTVSDRAQGAVGIWRKVYANGISLKVKNGSDERRILTRETTRSDRGLEVVEGTLGTGKSPWSSRRTWHFGPSSSA